MKTYFIMKKTMTACALFACALCAKAYDIETTVYMENDTKWCFDIALANNDIAFTAFQLDITLEGDVVLKQENLAPGLLMIDHRMMLANPHGHYRVLAYSVSNTNLKATEGQLFSFSVEGDLTGITINKIVFSKSDGTSVDADVYTSPLNSADEDAAKNIAADKDVQKAIYNMEGKQVYKIDRRGICIQKEKKN